MNKIEEYEDGFYYWDSDDIIGPFTTFSQAETSLNASLKWEAKDQQSTIRKMKDNMGV